MNAEQKKRNLYDEAMEKCKKPMERLFYIFFALIFIYDYISSSMMMFPFTAFIGNSLMKILPIDMVEIVYDMILNLRHLIIIPALFTVFFEAKGYRRKLLLGGLLLIGWFYAVYWREIGDTMVFSSLLVIVACAGRDIRKIMKIALISGASVIMLAFVLSRFGIIEDLSWNRPDSTFARHAFGMNYCTDLACHVMFLIFIYMFLRNGKLKWWEYAVVLGLTLINILFVDGRIALFCTIMAAIGCAAKAIYEAKHWRISERMMKLIGHGMVLVFIVAAVIMFASGLLYKDDPAAWYSKSVSWNNRFWTNHILLQELPFSWFGTYFLQVGSGGTNGPLDYYFWVDGSFNRVYAMYGVVAFAIYMTLLTGIQIRLNKRKAYFAMFLMALVAADCMMEHHMIEVAFNTFLVMAFADMDTLPWLNRKEEMGKDSPGKNKNIDTDDR